MMRRPLIPLLVLAAVAALAGCATRASAGGRLPIVAAFYPLQFVSERIGGDLVRVTNLTKPGAEPHDVELSPRQVAQISDAKLAVYLHGFQPAVDDAIKQNAKTRGTTSRPRSPWSSPVRGTAPTRTSGSTRSGWPPSPTPSGRS